MACTGMPSWAHSRCPIWRSCSSTFRRSLSSKRCSATTLCWDTFGETAGCSRSRLLRRTTRLSSLVQANADLAASSRYIFDELKIDLSSTAAIEPLLGNSGLGFQFSADLANAEVFLDYILPFEPWKLRKPIKFGAERNRLIVELPPETSGDTGHLRRLLTMNLWFEGGSRLQRVSCI